jgi:uncharacterized OB-fold protein
MNTRPLPTPDALTHPYWDAVKEHRFALPRCEVCNHFHFYPRATCPHCGSDGIVWSPGSGRGTVYSFTQVHRAPSPAFEAGVPYIVAVIELDEGPHLMSSIVGGDAGVVKIGQPVRVSYLDIDDTALPVFEPISDDKT